MDITSKTCLELGGTWQIAFDKENEGAKQNWTGSGYPGKQALPVQVPGIWNIEYPDEEGVAFYRTSFTIPVGWDGKSILIHFEGAIYHCQVWVDGKFAGSHEGGYTPFWFDITSMVKSGKESQMVVRVASSSLKKDVDGMNLFQLPLSKHSWYYVYGGLWGHVNLVAVSKIACQSMSIDPNLRTESVNLELCLNNRTGLPHLAEARMRVFDPDSVVVFDQQNPVSVLPGETHFQYTIQLPKPMAWSCEHPKLYRMETTVIDVDGKEDTISSTFGMRDFTVHNGQFFLNGDPTYIRGVLLQPNFPITLITHPTREMLVKEITLAKEAGFNLIRTHLQPPAAGFLDLADQMGMMVYAETNLGWIRDSPRMTEHGKRETQALIERDRNHPSVVIWGVYNENPPASAFNGEILARWARAIDPSRVIVDNSGGSLAIDQDFGWIDRVTYLPAYQNNQEHIEDIHVYLGSPLPRAIYHWLKNLGTNQSSQVLADEQLGSPAVMDEFDRECRTYNGQIFVSELGYGGMSDLDETVAGFEGRNNLLDARQFILLRDELHLGYKERHLDKVFGSVRNMYLEAQRLQVVGNTQQIEALLVNPRISGFVITQYNDVSYEFHAGLVDLWRNPKQAYYACKRLNQPNVIVLVPGKTSGIPGETIEFELTLLNRHIPAKASQLLVTVTGPSGQETTLQKAEINLHTGIQPFENLQVSLEDEGTVSVKGKLMDGQVCIAETEKTILGMKPVNWGSLSHSVQSYGQAPSMVPLLDPATSTPIENGIHLAAIPRTVTGKEWETLLDVVAAGGTGVIGAFRIDDQLALDAFHRHGLDLKIRLGIGSWMGSYHWIPQSDLFKGLKAGGLALEPYTEIMPKYVLHELGGEVLAGSFCNTQPRRAPLAMLWLSDIELISFGKGRLLFCQYRAFEKIAQDPVASRLAYNVLHYAGNLPKKL